MLLVKPEHLFMKNILGLIISISNLFYIKFIKSNVSIKCSKFFLFRLDAENNNYFDLCKTHIRKTRFVVKGNNNKIITTGSVIENSLISINGVKNTIHLGDGVVLRNANIIIRGEGCSINIGKNTTFGGVRIVNVGRACDVVIGASCLFADNIEIWASDTHLILDDSENVINAEQSIYIKNNVWVGSGVTILKGVTIEQGAIVGMKTLVTKDIPSKSISVGHPNKVIKENVHWQLEYNL
jgi:acetyltransferase-like isoleucine patch superfamily enzyme